MKTMREVAIEGRADALLRTAQMFLDCGREIPAHILDALAKISQLWKDSADVPGAVRKATRRYWQSRKGGAG